MALLPLLLGGSCPHSPLLHRAHIVLLTAFSLCAKAAAAEESGSGWVEKRKDNGQVVQELKMEAPVFTEEDQYGYVMPERYRCSSCKAVVYHLDADLRKKQPKSRRLKEWEYTELFDETCRSAFSGYGVRLVNGENELSGPGLKAAQELAPGSGAIQMGGDGWSKRLGEICRKLVYEDIGEDELYDKYHASGELTQGLCNETRHCVPPKPQPSKRTEKTPKASTGKEAGKAGKQAEKSKSSKQAEKPRASGEQGAAGTASSERHTVQPTVRGEELMDVQTFLRTLATDHGYSAEEYLAVKTQGEWEKLTVAMASRLFGRLADAESTGSCRT